MLATILSWFSAPIIQTIAGPLLEAYKTKVAGDNDGTRILADLAGRELEVAKREMEVRSAERMAMAWHHPVMLIGYCLAAYVFKIVVYDTMLDLGTTAPIKGQVGEWLGQVLVFFVGGGFATSALASVAALIRRR